MNISLKLFDNFTYNMAFMAGYKLWTPSFLDAAKEKTKKLMTGIISHDIMCYRFSIWLPLLGYLRRI